MEHGFGERGGDVHNLMGIYDRDIKKACNSSWLALTSFSKMEYSIGFPVP